MSILTLDRPTTKKAIGPELILDASVTSRVRVRAWRLQGPRKSWRPTAHDGVEVAYVDKGGVLYRVGRRTLEVTSGMAIVVPAGVEHATTIEEGTQARSMRLGVDMVEEIASAMNSSLCQDPQLLAETASLGTLTRLINEEAASEGSGKIMAVEALSETLIVGFLRLLADERERAVAGPLDPRLHAAVAMIDECYAEPLTVDDLARAAALSRFHFSRLFKEQMGMSPYQYLVQVRVERAAELLRGGRRNVTEAALSVGFQDLSRFSRAFSGRFGCKPSEMMPATRRVARIA